MRKHRSLESLLGLALLGPSLALALLAFPLFKGGWLPLVCVLGVPACAFFRVSGLVVSLLALSCMGYSVFLSTPVEERFFLALQAMGYGLSFLLTSFMWERVFYTFSKREKEAKNRLYHLKQLDEKIRSLKSNSQGEVADLLSKVVAYKRQIDEQKVVIRSKDTLLAEMGVKLQDATRERQLFETLLKSDSRPKLPTQV